MAKKKPGMTVAERTKRAEMAEDRETIREQDERIGILKEKLERVSGERNRAQTKCEELTKERDAAREAARNAECEKAELQGRIRAFLSMRALDAMDDPQMRFEYLDRMMPMQAQTVNYATASPGPYHESGRWR